MARKHAEARSRVEDVEAERDDLIRQAYRDGGMTIRQIAGLVGVSHQRVAQILKG